MTKLEILRQNDLTHGLTDPELSELAELFRSKHAKRGEVIFREGDPSNDLYIIGRGRVNVLIFSSSQPGQMEQITTLKDNDIYGEFSLIDGSRRSATIIADEESDFLYISFLDFHRFLENHHRIGFIVMRNISKILTAKLRRMNFEVRNAIF